MFGRTSDEALKWFRDLVEKAAEIKQLSFSRHLSHWKRRIATTLQSENALFILNSSAQSVNQLSFSRLLSHWKRRFATVLQKENALLILNSSSHVLFASNRFEPNCEPNLGEVLNLESIHCS